MNHSINVQRVSRARNVPDDAAFGLWTDAALGGCACPQDLTIRVVGKSEARQLNRQFRGKDHASNVLSFRADLPEEMLRELTEKDGFAPLGDLVLCAPVIAEEARQQGKPGHDHWAHMVVHGALHLQGYDHQEEREAQRMERREVEILTALGVADPYQ